jgi:hypothetical protein
LSTAGSPELPDRLQVRAVSYQRLLELLGARLRPARKLELEPTADAGTLPLLATHFGGTPYAEAGETWPICPACKQSLTFIGQFDAREAPVAFGSRIGLFTFFYCWHCMPWGLDREMAGSWVVRNHPVAASGDHVPLHPLEPPVQITRPCAVRFVPMTSHPDWDEVEWRCPELRAQAASLAPEEPYVPYQPAVAELVGEYPITTQMAGYARWIQSAPRHPCPVCRQPRGFVLEIDSLCEADCDWGLSGLAYLFSCPEHPDKWALRIQAT